MFRKQGYICVSRALMLVLLLNALATHGQDGEITVTGRVVSIETGMPLKDINIQAANSAIDPVTTDDEGNFEIQLPSRKEQIHISYPGYKDKVVYLAGRTDLEIWLADEQSRSLSDPVDQAFRSVPLRDHTGAVATTETGSLLGSTSASFERALQGRMAGLNVVSRSGMPGEGAYLHTRGFASLYASSMPQVIVDGMFIRPDGFSGSVIHGYQHNPLANIDKRDISSIVLLKDAASTGMYGLRASNGVLLINTTPPRGGKTTLDVSISGGVSAPPDKIPVMDADHYSSYLMEQLYQSGMSSKDIFSSYPFLKYDPDYLYSSRYDHNTEWQDEVFNTGILYDAHLLVRGGDARARYSLSGGYLNKQGIIKNTDFNRFNFRFNSVVQVSSKFDIGFNLGYTSSRSNLMETGANPQTNPVYASLIKSPLLTVYQKDREGLSLPVFDDVADFGLSNPAVIVSDVEARVSGSDFLGVSYLNVNITDHLSARAQFGLDRLKSNEKIFVPSWGIAMQGDGSAERSMKVKVDQFYSLLGEARISYLRRFAYTHDLSFDAGVRYLYDRLYQDYGSAQNSATDEFKDLNSGKVDEKAVGGREERWSWLNYFASARYIFNDRYIVTGNLSLDASSKAGKGIEEGIQMGGYPFAVLPSAGIAWRISSEPFLPEIRFLDELKLRATYGLTGSDDIANYYTRLYYRTIPYYSITGVTLNGLYNPDLRWETVKKRNAGFDLSLFRARMILRADWFNSLTEDMITYTGLPRYYGVENYIENGGSCSNDGIELSLYSKLIDGTFSWEIDLNYSSYRNEVLNLKGGEIITSFTGGEKITRVGQPMGQFWGYHSLGVFSTREEADQAGLVDKAGRKFTSGDMHFEDLDGNGIIDEYDKTIIGDPHPDFIAGIYNDFSYKGFSLGLLVNIVNGTDVYNHLRSRTESMNGIENQSTAIYNRWITDGQVTEIPAASHGDPMGNTRFSTRWIEDGSFIRLSSATLSYSFPGKLSFINELNIYVTGTNLLTYSKYLGYDPEFSYGDGVLGQAIDYGGVPQPRTVAVGMRIGL